MPLQKSNLPGFSTVSRRTLLTVTAVAVAAALVIGLCISISNGRSIHAKYTSARTRLVESVYENLYMLVHRSEEIPLAGADVQGSILPAMEEYFAIAEALDAVVRESYGEAYAVLGASDATALQSAFDAYDTAFRGGHGTDEAQSMLLTAVERVSAALYERFDDAGHLK